MPLEFNWPSILREDAIYRLYFLCDKLEAAFNSFRKVETFCSKKTLHILSELSTLAAHSEKTL